MLKGKRLSARRSFIVGDSSIGKEFRGSTRTFVDIFQERLKKHKPERVYYTRRETVQRAGYEIFRMRKVGSRSNLWQAVISSSSSLAISFCWS